MHAPLFVLLLALAAPVPVESLAAGAGIGEMRLKCEELQEAILEPGLTGDSAGQLLRDIGSEADLLRDAAWHTPAPDIIASRGPGCAVGAMVGAAGGLAVGIHEAGGLPHDWSDATVSAGCAVGCLVGAVAGCLLGPLPGAMSRRAAISRLRAGVNRLVERYNRLAAARHRFRGPHPPGQLF